MHFIGYIYHVMPMLMCLAGLWLFTVRRENCQKKFVLCMVVTAALEYVIYYLILTEDAGAQGVPLSKIITMFMISLLVFWSGLYVYGGWPRVGTYILATDLILAIAERIVWTIWIALTHRPVERSVIYFKEGADVKPEAFLAYLPDVILLIPLLGIAYKLRSRPLRPEWLFKIIVITYLGLGSSPLIARTGLDGGFGVETFLTLIFWLALFFLLILSLHITSNRENRRLLYLRKQVVAEQSRLLMMQKEKVRRLRHDVKKHLINLEYILEKEPDLRSDPALLGYQEKLNANEEWMKGVFYCDSPVLNLCFEQVKRYCDDRGIVPEIVLKRLNCSGWTQEDQLTFGTLLFDLLQLFGGVRSLAAVQCTGDCLLGQNVLHVTMETGTSGGQNQNQSKEQKKDMAKNRKLISDLEKDIRLVLAKYEGRMERVDDSGQSEYVINWRDGAGGK